MIDQKPKTQAGRPDLFQYLEYRSYLGDFLEWRRKLNPRFSRRAFSQKHFGSTGILYSVVGGDRDLGPTLRMRFASALGMSERETGYFDLLVRHNQAKSGAERSLLSSLLSSFRLTGTWPVGV